MSALAAKKFEAEKERVAPHLAPVGVGRELEIYTHRFSPEQNATRERTWQVLCNNFFSQYIRQSDCVVDLGAGEGHFIRNIRARQRIAVDLNPNVGTLKAHGIEVVQCLATEISAHLNEQVDVLFMSNFLEHLPSKRELLEVINQCHRVLKPGGRLMILQPNIRYVGVAYWDYVDHQIALTEHSLVEALEVSSFRINQLIPRFVPYTFNSSLGVISRLFPWSIELYLKLPILWRFFGQQTFVVAEKTGE